MFLGGSAGSTSGSIKVMRHLLIIKNGILEFKRTLHTNAIIPVRYNNKTVSEQIVYNISRLFCAVHANLYYWGIGIRLFRA